jgi:L-lysine exporter family protein LysE/ArgO
MQAVWAGFSLSLGLILAIGAQNAFVLRQGLRREHVLAVCLFCGLSDALLIGLGVAGFGAVTAAAPVVADVMLWAGVAFLVWYGARSLRSALTGSGALAAMTGQGAPLWRTLAMLAALTWANPHVYLDTIVFLGAISAQYPGQGMAFWAGAATASLSFFFALGFGARTLAPLFARPVAWRVLDGVIAATMFVIAFGLIRSAGLV